MVVGLMLTHHLAFHRIKAQKEGCLSNKTTSLLTKQSFNSS